MIEVELKNLQFEIIVEKWIEAEVRSSRVKLTSNF